MSMFLPLAASMISCFSSGLATLPASALFPISAFNQYRWDPYDAISSPITREEIDYAIATDNCIAPGLYQDDPDHDRLDNFLDGTRKTHIGRVAWFVKNYDPALDTPVGISLTEFSFCCLAGNHRLAAKIYLGIKELECEFISGQIKLIENKIQNLKWISKPLTDNFGTNLIVCGEDFWEIESHAHPRKIYVNSQYGCNLQLSFQGEKIWARVSNGDMVDKSVVRLFHGLDVTIEQIIGACAEIISPALNEPAFKLYVEENFFAHQPKKKTVTEERKHAKNTKA